MTKTHRRRKRRFGSIREIRRTIEERHYGTEIYFIIRRCDVDRAGKYARHIKRDLHVAIQGEGAQCLLFDLKPGYHVHLDGSVSFEPSSLYVNL